MPRDGRRHKRILPRYGSLITHFWSQVDKNGPIVREELGPCWLWRGGSWVAEEGNSYGLFSIGRTKELTHRFVCEMTHGPLGDQYALHACDNPPCVNPSHIRPGTPKENTREARERGRFPAVYRTINRYPNKAFAIELDSRGLPPKELSRRIGASYPVVLLWLKNTAIPMGSKARALANEIGEDTVRRIWPQTDFERSKRSQRVTDAMRREIIRLYTEENRTHGDIMALFGICRMTVIRVLREALATNERSKRCTFCRATGHNRRGCPRRVADAACGEVA